MSDIDHKAIATVALFADRQYRDVRTLAEAQIHATLYLAEQQRIANLQAERALLWARSERVSSLDSGADASQLNREIRKALGLS